MTSAHYSRDWYRNHPGKQREYHLRRRYGMEPGDFEALEVQQGGVCRICHVPDLKLVVDHDHDTGKVRGLLCIRCNTNLQWFEENQGAISDYLY